MSTDEINGGNARINTVARQVERQDVANPLKSRAVQEKFISHYAITGALGESCSVAGISEPTGRKWLADPRFVAAVFRYRQTALAGHAAGIAYGVLVEIMTKTETDPAGKVSYYAGPSERRQAAKAVLELAGHSAALAAAQAQEQAVAALHELSEEQLAAHIAQAQDTLAALQRQPESSGKPDIPPRPAAHDLL